MRAMFAVSRDRPLCTARPVPAMPEKKPSSPRKRAPEPGPIGHRKPPHNIELEQALLACCILEGGKDTLGHCITEKIHEGCFYKPAHQIIFRHMLKLYDGQVAVDEIILAENLRKSGELEEAGGDTYLVDITNRIETTAHLHYYIRAVRDLHLVREMVRISGETMETAYSGVEDVAEFVEKVEQQVFQVSEGRISEHARPISESIDGAVRLVTQMLAKKGDITGVGTGFTDLDKLTTGWHAGEMIVVAARPSMGKTSLALNMAEAAILPRRKNHPATKTLMFSLEMGAEQLAMRLLCGRARVNMSKLRDGFIEPDKNRHLASTATELKAAPFFIDDSSGLSILELRAKARRWANHHLGEGTSGMIVVDYLQLVTGTDPRQPREQQIAEISRGMKAMARELQVPVIVLGQLNRESEREKRQPRLSDLRESGSIEQDADVVLLLSKPRDYDEQQDVASDVVQRDLIIAKQRNGPIDTVPLHFTKNLTRFENFTSQIA